MTCAQVAHEVHEPKHVYAEHHEKHLLASAGALHTAQPWHSAVSLQVYALHQDAQ